MKNILFAILFLTVVTSLFAQTETEVLLRFSKQESLIRIVLETAEESFIKKTNIVTLPSQIKIEFPGPFNLTVQKNFPLEAVPEDRLLVINLKEQGEIKILRLPSPPRLVFDIQTVEKQPVLILSKVFVLDAGHGGYDFGITAGDAREKDISLNLAKDLDVTLLRKGKRVFLTRKVDQYMSLIDRINFVNQKKPDVFISLHSSMSKNFVLYVPVIKDYSSDEMVDFYSLSSRQKKYIRKSKALSDSIGKAIKDEFKVDVIYREMPLPILNSAGAPSVLIEFPSPKFMVYDQQIRTRFVNSVINGIAAYGQ
ncbi:MAG: N-acetylmuramoyl-L-alanine amidase [Nitrospirota bacterium]